MTPPINKHLLGIYTAGTLGVIATRWDLKKADSWAQHVSRRTLPALVILGAINASILKGRFKLFAAATFLQLLVVELAGFILSKDQPTSATAGNLGSSDQQGTLASFPPITAPSAAHKHQRLLVPLLRGVDVGPVNSILENEDVACVTHTGDGKTQKNTHVATSITVQGYPEAKLVLVFCEHQGADASDQSKNTISTYMSKYLAHYVGGKNSYTKADVLNAIKAAFADLRESTSHFKCGSTCSGALCFDGDIWSINIGDSRTIFVPNEGNVLTMTDDAIPDKKRFNQHAQKYGGNVRAHRLYHSNANTYLRTAGALGNVGHLNSVFRRPKVVHFNPSKFPDGGILLCGTYDAFAFVSSEVYAELVREIQTRKATIKDLANALINPVADYNGRSCKNIAFVLHSIKREFLEVLSGKMTNEETESHLLLINAPENVRDLAKKHKISSYNDLKAKEKEEELSLEEGALIRAYRAYTLEEAEQSLANQQSFLRDTPDTRDYGFGLEELNNFKRNVLSSLNSA